MAVAEYKEGGHPLSEFDYLNDTSTKPSQSSAPIVEDIPSDPPPDGGKKAWAQVLMGHLVLINGWGYLTSFGLFQSYYVDSLQASPSAISWIGSVQIFLVYFIGTFSGRALDAGYYHTVLISGSFLQVLAVFMTSISSEYWQLFLAQGICKGLGDGLVFCPTVSLVATYFSKKRALAMACTASGGATGGLIFPLIARQLLPNIGFAWTVRVMGLVIFCSAVAAISIARVRLPPRRLGPMIEWSAFQEVSYSLYCVGMFFNLWAVYFAYFYISTFSKMVIGVSSSTSLTILLLMNAVGLPGRLLCGLTADRALGPVNALTIVCSVSGILLYCWSAVSSIGGLYAFCVVYGISAAGVQSLFPAACASLTTDLKRMGVRTGMCFSVVSIACLTGPPIAGALIQQGQGSFIYAQMFGGSAFMAGILALVGAKLAKNGTNFWVRM